MKGPYWVNANSDVARDVGDEALLLAKAAPTLVAPDRAAAVALALRETPPMAVVEVFGSNAPAARAAP